MRYSNPIPEEGINTTPASPLKELLLLTGGLIGTAIVIIALLGFLADKLAHYIPFETEVAIASSLTTNIDAKESDLQTYLQRLAIELAKQQLLPPEIAITVHYVDDETVNALATLGGHIVVFKGLLRKLSSENAIAMVLAHEIAHVQHRHPIQTLGRSAVISLALNTIGFASADAGGILGSAGLLTSLSFSRQQEQVSDFTALQSLQGYYGHLNGATDLFQVLKREKDRFMPNITFLSSHPLGENRIQNILDYAEKKEWPVTGRLTAIPPFIQQLLAETATTNGRVEPNPE